VSLLIYQGITLSRLQVLSYEREPTYVGPDFYHTVHRLRVRGVYNPQVNAWALARGAGAPRFGPGPHPHPQAWGPGTDVALRHILLQPRGRLVYAVAGLAVLVSPATAGGDMIAQADQLNGALAALETAAGQLPPSGPPTIPAEDLNLLFGAPDATDAQNGPIPLACDVVRVSGAKTFLVDFAIETYVNEASLYVTPTPLVSHRWSAAEAIDQDYYSTRTIQGVAHFRTDRMINLGAMADDFRAALFHPLPGGGWKRIHVDVQAAEDGSALAYSLVDRQLALSIIPAGVTRIEAWQTVRSGKFTPGGAGEGALDFVSGLLGSSQSDKPKVDVTAGDVKNFVGVLPQTEIIIVARVWGRADVYRKTLEHVGLQVVFGRLELAAMNFLARTWSAGSMEITHDLAGSFVEVQARKVTALSSASYAHTGDFDTFGMPNPGVYFPLDNDDTPGVFTASHAEVPPMGLPYGGNIHATGTRGTFLQRLATAALLAQDGSPTSPPQGAAVSQDRYPPPVPAGFPDA
jgi:hypothetical protein